MEEYSCNDCKFYLPVDVFRGMCKLSKEKISPDGKMCEKMEKIAKCRFCSHFSIERDYLGQCMGITLAYPDMIASKCADFKWYNQN